MLTHGRTTSFNIRNTRFACSQLRRDKPTMANVPAVAGDEIRELPAVSWIRRDMPASGRRGTIRFQPVLQKS